MYSLNDKTIFQLLDHIAALEADRQVTITHVKIALDWLAAITEPQLPKSREALEEAFQALLRIETK